ncbi:5-hydroxyisourate hydrolase-like [Teleopsis dalmanni]|uniref:5-hydroxyisourate hydrolase-like n=1 Tax=Teleopsis dalmanni TaxID=139649 RepID=UPI0018CD4665|nr:5-hydroxyisourate hydrolase-like [Teleopsis dalmanni]XP_037938389.1 5-hydroxyisourate hydrolase-like [Teleopsis dalmanni]
MSIGWERVRLRMETINMTDNAPDSRTISSHILDTSLGKPAANVKIIIYRLENNQWQELNQASTDDDGRVTQLITLEQFQTGIYKLHFNVRPYFEQNQVKSFYPFIEIIAECTKGQHYHIPLLLNPFGYSTYRGS